MLIVSGATGRLGRAVVERLVERVAVDGIGASVRDPGKAADLRAIGVRVRRGDFEDPDSMRHAFEGATQVLIVSSNARAYGGDPIAQHRNAINAACAVGARRIVYTSHMAASGASAFPPMRDHETTEGMLRASGVAWTALRNGFYAASAIDLMGDLLRAGVIEAPADGKVSWTTHADLAEAAAIILASDGRFDGPTPPLTGRQSLDLKDLADAAGDLQGRPIDRRIISDEELGSRLAARGVPGGAVEMVLGLYIASRQGEFSTADATLERLLGRPPTSMRDVLAARIGNP